MVLHVAAGSGRFFSSKKCALSHPHPFQFSPGDFVDAEKRDALISEEAYAEELEDDVVHIGSIDLEEVTPNSPLSRNLECIYCFHATHTPFARRSSSKNRNWRSPGSRK